MANFFKIISTEEIHQLPFEELKKKRKDALTVVGGIIFPAAVLSLCAIWLEWSPFTQSAMLVAMLLCIPAIISTSRMSRRFHELNSERIKENKHKKN